MENIVETQKHDLISCSCCGQPFEANNVYNVCGQYYCRNCYESETFECEMCGDRFPDSMKKVWGDMWICPDCIEDYVPSFDQDENDEETEDSYEKLRETYIGLRTSDLEYGDNKLEYTDLDSDPAGINYFITVTVDDEGIVKDISRLHASIMLCEDIKSSESLPYPIESDDYDWVVKTIFNEYGVEFTDAEFEDDYDDTDEK